MRLALLFLLFIAVSATAIGDVEITREEVSSIKSYDLEKFGHIRPTLAGKIVKLKFNSRYGPSTKQQDGSFFGQLRLWSTGTATFKYGYLSVVVPPEGEEWFMKLPSEEKRSSIIVFARVPEGDESARVQLIGREIKTDSKGSRIVW